MFICSYLNQHCIALYVLKLHSFKYKIKHLHWII